MTSLINKIEQLIKREKTTPERKRAKDESNKSSNEILSELFSAFNADPPKIDDSVVKKSKKSKKKHKKEKKKRSRSYSNSSSSDSDGSDYSHKRKKRKKSKDRRKEKKRKHSTRSPSIPISPPLPIKPDPDLVKVVKQEAKNIKIEDVKVKKEKITIEPKIEGVQRRVSIKYEEPTPIDASNIPMPDSPTINSLDSSDLRLKLDSKKSDSVDNEKNKGRIQIKNLKFSAVYEETVKKAEEEAKKKAKQYEDGEYTDSSSSSETEVKSNSQFPKTSDPSGILKQQVVDDTKMPEERSSRKSKHSDGSHKSSKKDVSRRSTSRSRRSRSSSRRRRGLAKHRRSRSRHRSGSRTRQRSRSRHRSGSRSRHGVGSRVRHRSGSRSRYPRHVPRHPSPGPRTRRSPTGVRLADHEKKRLLEVARRNAINMLKNGAVPAGAAALPPHTRSQVMAAIQSGGKSVDELTDFCKHLSKKEALGELSSVSSHDEGSENEDTLAFHHPFLVKEKAPIVMNIRGGVPLPVKSTAVVPVNKDELRIQFPVSSGSQHREKASEWRPVSPKKDMEIAKLNQSSSAPKPLPSPAAVKAIAAPPADTAPAMAAEPDKNVPLAIAPAPAPELPPYLKSFTSGSTLSSVPDPAGLPALPAPGPQAYPPGVAPPKSIDLAQIVSQKIAMIRKEQEQNEFSSRGFGWCKDRSSGLFTGSTGAQILTPRELAAGTQAWAKKDQLVRAAPVHGGMGMALLQKMGWTPGQGLGKEGTGTLQPLLLEVKLDTKGLTAKEEASRNKAARNIRAGGRRGPAPLVAGGKHPVSLLGEYCSKMKLGPPEYNLCFECGPDHKKNFLFRVKVAGVEYQPAVASINKKQAKADAANLALQKLGLINPGATTAPIPTPTPKPATTTTTT